MDVLLIANDQTLTVTVQDEITGDYINDAAVTATVKDPADNAIAGQSWPLTLDYVAASNGVYRGNLEDTLVLKPNIKYWIIVDIDAGSGRKARLKFRRYAKDRTD